MTKFLYMIVGLIAKIHTLILGINDSYEYALNDKQLHFLVIGILGIALVLVIHPIFKSLAKRRTYSYNYRYICIYFNCSYYICYWNWTKNNKYWKYGICRYIIRYYRFCSNVFLLCSCGWNFQIYYWFICKRWRRLN